MVSGFSEPISFSVRNVGCGGGIFHCPPKPHSRLPSFRYTQLGTLLALLGFTRQKQHPVVFDFATHSLLRRSWRNSKSTTEQRISQFSSCEHIPPCSDRILFTSVYSVQNSTTAELVPCLFLSPTAARYEPQRATLAVHNTESQRAQIQPHKRTNLNWTDGSI